jgi:hypothetical protein
LFLNTYFAGGPVSDPQVISEKRGYRGLGGFCRSKYYAEKYQGHGIEEEEITSFQPQGLSSKIVEK